MSAPVGLIVNARSHAVARRGSVLDAVAHEVPSAMYLRLDNLAGLGQHVANMARAGVRRIFIEGGDGTLFAVLTQCLSPGAGFAQPPEFAVLPGGSTNLACRIFGLRTGKASEIARLIDAFGRGENTTGHVCQKALKIESDAMAHPAIGFLLSTGALARAMIYTQRELHGDGARGSFSVAGAIARFLVAPERYLDTDGVAILRPSALTLHSDAREISGDHAMSLMTTLPRLSLGLNPFWGGAGEAIAMTHATWPLANFRTTLLKILAGRAGAHLEQQGLTSLRSERMVLNYRGPVMLDGEILPVPSDGRWHVTTTAPLCFLR